MSLAILDNQMPAGAGIMAGGFVDQHNHVMDPGMVSAGMTRTGGKTWSTEPYNQSDVDMQ